MGISRWFAIYDQQFELTLFFSEKKIHLVEAHIKRKLI